MEPPRAHKLFRRPYASFKEKMGQDRIPCYKNPAIIGCWLIVLVGVAACVYFGVEYLTQPDATEINIRALPPNFYIGCSTSSYQIEGAWDEEGKGPSIWDTLTQTQPQFIDDRSTGDIACDSYHKYKEDVQMLKQTGFNMYRLSISWPRVLPNGDVSLVNKLGLDYYHNVIDELLANDIEPMVTLYHWDLPQTLEDIGGWKNPVIADYFVNYTDIIFREFGDKVKWWCTINEMRMIAEKGYGGTTYAPALNESGTSDYIVAHNLIRAHAKVYRHYETNYKPTQQGKIGASFNIEYYKPHNPNSSEDIAAVNRQFQFTAGLYIHPIYSEKGDYPPVVRQIVDANSKAEGLTSSRLPTFTSQEIQDIKGSADFFGLNHYFTQLTTVGETGASPSISRDSRGVNSNSTRDPQGMRSLLNWVNNNYKIPLLFVTENGRSGVDEYEDTERVEFFHGFVGATLEAIYLDGLNIRGYIVWSILDNFEWQKGYTSKFGLWKVDFNDTTRPRTIRKSGRYFQKLLSTGVLPDIPFVV